MTAVFPLALPHSAPPSGSLVERLERYPELKETIETLLSIAENAAGDLVNADAAEQTILEEIRKLGQQTLQTWGTHQQEQQAESFRKANPSAHRSRKKHSTGTAALESSKSSSRVLPI